MLMDAALWDVLTDVLMDVLTDVLMDVLTDVLMPAFPPGCAWDRGQGLGDWVVNWAPSPSAARWRLRRPEQRARSL